MNPPLLFLFAGVKMRRVVVPGNEDFAVGGVGGVDQRKGNHIFFIEITQSRHVGGFAALFEGAQKAKGVGGHGFVVA